MTDNTLKNLLGRDISVEDIIERFEEIEVLKDGETTLEQIAEFKQLQGILKALEGEGGDVDWRGVWYPQTLIHEDNFETAMDELLEDIGDIPKNLPCYLTISIDYAALKMDYSHIEIMREGYLYR